MIMQFYTSIYKLILITTKFFSIIHRLGKSSNGSATPKRMPNLFNNDGSFMDQFKKMTGQGDKALFKMFFSLGKKLFNFLIHQFNSIGPNYISLVKMYHLY